MKKKLCPYCDREIKRPHYCDFCHRPVRYSKEQEINYYLNERHPSQEEDCSYHGSHGSLQTEQETKEPPVPSFQRKSAPKAVPKLIGVKYRKKWTFPKIVAVIIFILVLLMVMIGLSESSPPKRIPETGIGAADQAFPGYVDAAVFETESEWNLQDPGFAGEEEAGVGIYPYGYLPVDAVSLSAALTSEFTGAGYLTGPWSQWSGSGDQTYYECDVFREDQDGGTVTMIDDTASEALSSLVLYSEDLKEIRMMSECAINGFSSLGIFPEGTDGEYIINTLFENARENATMLMETGSLEIALSMYRYDEGDPGTEYYISFYADGYFTDPA